MRVFVTGSTGFIGTQVVKQLIAAGHTVLGLVRSDASAKALADAGAEAHRGDLTDLTSLTAGAADSDGVIHTAFDHDFSNFLANCDKDRRAIAALAAGLTGSNRPLLITSGTGMGSQGPGKLASEDVYDAAHANPRKASEEAGMAAMEKGINVAVIRLPQVHDRFKQGLITPLVQMIKQKGVAAYIGDGQNRWPACAVDDAAAVYVKAFEKAAKHPELRGARYNAVAEEGITARQIMETLARGLGLPTKSIPPAEAAAYYGWMAMFIGLDMSASSALTQQRLAWKPTGPGLIADLQQMDYAAI